MGVTSGHNAGTTIDSGLPNITGALNNVFGSQWKYNNNSAIYSGVSESKYGVNTASGSDYFILNFNASKSNSIYGKSSIVQPPAYYVYFWQRTA